MCMIIYDICLYELLILQFWSIKDKKVTTYLGILI